MSRIACFFFDHIWRIENIFLEGENIMCTSQCQRCPKRITYPIAPIPNSYEYNQ